jgi:CRISPR-associated protein Csd2
MSIHNRYEFVLLFDVKDGNPNGDPDAGNLPRLDTETGQGLVTDVSIKRKIRNYVGMVKGKEDGSFELGYDIYIKEKAVLGRAHFTAFEKCGINLGQDATEVIPEALVEQFEELILPDGMDRESDDEDRPVLRLSAVLDKEEAKGWLKEGNPPKPVKDFISKALKNVKARKPKQEETERGRVRMCADFYDIRTFGAVLSLKTAPNCGQVRGPVQLTFARSLDPIVTLEHSITRCAVATEAEATKQSGDNRTMGRKFTVPYGLYRAHGFISAHFAAQTRFDEADLKLLWDALTSMFDHDHSAARGEMATRGLFVFKHDSHLGNAPAHKLFDLIQVMRKDPAAPARSISDYSVMAPPAGRLDGFPGVELQILC